MPQNNDKYDKTTKIKINHTKKKPFVINMKRLNSKLILIFNYKIMRESVLLILLLKVRLVVRCKTS